MGGEVILLMETGEISKLHAIIDKFILPKKHCEKGEDGIYWFKAPDIGYKEGHGCWIEFRGRVVQVGYSLGGDINSIWACAIACGIRDRFRVKKGGWDSVGYCDDFMTTWPFKLKIWMAMESIKNGITCGIYAKTPGEDIIEYWKMEQIFENRINEIFYCTSKHRSIVKDFKDYEAIEKKEQDKRDAVLKKIGSIAWREDTTSQEQIGSIDKKTVNVKVAVIPGMEDRFVLYPDKEHFLILYDMKQKSTLWCTKEIAERKILDILKRE